MAAIVNLWFSNSQLHIRLTDGYEVGVSLDRYPRLRDTSEEARNDWRLIGRGQGIHWEAIDG